MLGRLATSIAHEVNQPLAAIVTDCETTKQTPEQHKPRLGHQAHPNLPSSLCSSQGFSLPKSLGRRDFFA